MRRSCRTIVRTMGGKSAHERNEKLNKSNRSDRNNIKPQCVVTNSEKVHQSPDGNFDFGACHRSDTLECTFCACSVTGDADMTTLTSNFVEALCHIVSLDSIEWVDRLVFSRLCFTCYEIVTEAAKLRQLVIDLEKQMVTVSNRIEQAIQRGCQRVGSRSALIHVNGASDSVNQPAFFLRQQLARALNLNSTEENESASWNCMDSTDPSCPIEQRESPLHTTDYFEDGMDSPSSSSSSLHHNITEVTSNAGSNKTKALNGDDFMSFFQSTMAKPRKQIHVVRADPQTEDTLESQTQLTLPNDSRHQVNSTKDVRNSVLFPAELTTVVVTTSNGRWILGKPKLHLQRIDQSTLKKPIQKDTSSVETSKVIKVHHPRDTLKRLKKLKERVKIEQSESEELTVQDSKTVKTDSTLKIKVVSDESDMKVEDKTDTDMEYVVRYVMKTKKDKRAKHSKKRHSKTISKKPKTEQPFKKSRIETDPTARDPDTIRKRKRDYAAKYKRERRKRLKELGFCRSPEPSTELQEGSASVENTSANGAIDENTGTDSTLPVDKTSKPLKPKRVRFGKSWMEKQIRLQVSRKPFSCPVSDCSAEGQFLSMFSVERHMRNCHGGEFKFFCSVAPCAMGFYTEAGLLEHKSRLHKDSAFPFLCESCPSTFGSTIALASHRRWKHATTRKFICSICQRQFTFQATLISHQAKTHPEELQSNFPELQLLKCTECDYISSTKFYLQLHKGKKHPEVLIAAGLSTRQNYSCPLPNCTFRTHTSSALKCHVNQTHTTERPCKCQLCPGTFKLERHLQAHFKRVHDKVREQCPHCHHTAANPKALADHISVIHYPEPKFKCEECGEAFPIRKYYLRHRLICAEGYRGMSRKSTPAFSIARRRREGYVP